MKRISKVLILVLILLTSHLVKAQIIDNYGVKIGAGLSNQYWEYKKSLFSDLSGWYDNKMGFAGQFYAEKYLGKYISVRPVLGYIQKGYTSDIMLTTKEGEEIDVKNNKVVFHNLSFDLSVKFIPIQKMIKPYIILGLREEYQMDYRSVIVDFEGEDVELDTELYDEFNAFTLSGLIGIGLSFNNLVFMDFEYNPAISKNYDSDFLSIKNSYFSLTMGLNINQIIK